MNKEEYNTDIIKEVNKARRNDIVILAKLRLKKGARYNSLKYLFSIYCLHCGDLSLNEGKTLIKKLGHLLQLKEYDINNQINSFVKNKEAFELSGENNYHFQTKSIINRLSISKDEQSYLSVLKDDYNPFTKDETTIIRNENIEINDSLDDIAEHYIDKDENASENYLVGNNEEDYSDEINEEDYLDDSNDTIVDEEDFHFDMD